MGISQSEIDRRLARARERTKGAGLDALFIFSDEYRPGHARYYTDFTTINMIEESSHAIYLPLAGDPVAWVGPLNTFAARRDSLIRDVRNIFGLESDIRELVAGSAQPIRRVGLVGENLIPVATFRMLSAGLGEVEIVDATEIVIAERQIKSPEEVALMERAAEIGDTALRTAIANARPGSTERDLVAIGEHVTRLAGGDIGCAYLAVTGINNELPTWRPTDRPIENGEVLMLDFSPMFEGYTSDVALTVSMPGASADQEKAVRYAWFAAAQMMEFYTAGSTAREVFQRTAAMVEKAGYSDKFLPYTNGMRAVGHSVGLDVVEPPDLGPDSDYVLEPGMMLSAKFDLHGFHWGGIRVEHVVHITEGGPRSLNCPLSDACPAKAVCKFYRPGGRTLAGGWAAESVQ